MLDYRLSDDELSQLRAAHRRAPSAREAYRINTVVLLGEGWTAAEVADALLIDADTVRDYFKRYKKGGLDALLRMNFVGPEALLDPEQIAELKVHLRERLHPNAAAVVHWVQERWKVRIWTPPQLQALRSLAGRFDCSRISGL
jgi:transposase